MFKRGMVFFGNKLSQEEFNDDQMRTQTFERGTEAVENNISGITIGVRLRAVCAISVQGSEETIDALQAFLEETDIGHFAEDDPKNPPFRAAALRK